MACGEGFTINGQTFDARLSIENVKMSTDLFGEGPTRDVAYICKGSQAANFMDALVGKITAVSLGGIVTYPNPHRYPGNELLCCLKATSDAIGPIGVDAFEMPLPGEVLIFAHYGVPQVDIDGTQTEMAFGQRGERFTSDTNRGYAAEYQVPPGVFTQDGDIYNRTRTVRLPHVEYVRSKLYVPYFYDELLKARVGRVNHASFFGHDRGTLLLDSWDNVPDFYDSSGRRVRAVTMRFLWRPYDWNAEIAPDPPYRWEILESDDGGTPLYTHEYADFEDLVEPL